MSEFWSMLIAAVVKTVLWFAKGFSWLFTHAWRVLAFVTVCVALVGIGYAIVQSAKSDCVVDHCYIRLAYPSKSAAVARVMQYRKWCADTVVGDYPTAEQARDFIKSIDCPLR